MSISDVYEIVVEVLVPDKVHMTDKNPIMNAKPVGHSVPLVTPSLVQTILSGFTFGWLIDPSGIQRTNSSNAIRFSQVPTTLICAIILVDCIVITPVTPRRPRKTR